MKYIRIAGPVIDDKTKREVLKVLGSNSLIQGKKVEEFEERFANYTGTKYAVAVSSGTAALHLALLSLSLSSCDEIITTPFSFIASSSSIVLSGLKPVFADINPKTYNIDPGEIRKKITKRTKGILPVHLYGLPCNMAEIKKIAKENSLFVIEDACQSHGAEFFGKKVGSLGDLSCFSFYPTKNMFAGEGGMITTNSIALVRRLRLLRSHGSDKTYHHKLIGFNYRMTDIAAAIGISQLEKLNQNNAKRINNALYLNNKMKKISKFIQLPIIPKGYKHVFHQYTITLLNGISRARVIQELQKLGIEARIYYPVPIPKQKAFQPLHVKGSWKNATEISKNVLSLPVHPGIARNELDRVVKAMLNLYEDI